MTARQPWCDPDSRTPFCRRPLAIEINDHWWTVETDGVCLLVEPGRRKGLSRKVFRRGGWIPRLCLVVRHLISLRAHCLITDDYLLSLPRPAAPPPGTEADRIAVHGPGGTVLVGGWFLRELWGLGDVRAMTAADGPYLPSLVFRSGDRFGLIMGITHTTKFHSAVVLGGDRDGREG